MEYTKNYHLPQWKKEDRIMMEDFNGAMGQLETGLTEAKSMADTAKKAAAAAYSPKQKPYVTGSYTGSGNAITIETGFRPSFLIISGAQDASEATYTSFLNKLAMTGGNALNTIITFTDTGFSVAAAVRSSTIPNLTMAYKTYDYIAFQ